MKIDWKEVAKSPGYLSMKAAVADEAKRVAKWGRKPDERYAESFRFAISRGTHYAIKRGVTLDVILNQWEEKRSYCFLNYYSNHNFPKLSRKVLKPHSISKILKVEKKWRSPSIPHEYKLWFKRKAQLIKSAVMTKRTGKKARWEKWRKEYEAGQRNL